MLAQKIRRNSRELLRGSVRWAGGVVPGVFLWWFVQHVRRQGAVQPGRSREQDGQVPALTVPAFSECKCRRTLEITE